MRMNQIPVLIASLIIAIAGSMMHESIASAAEAGPNEGLVVFSRSSSFKGKAIRFNIEQDGRPIGQLLAGSTIEVPLAPGSYVFSVRAPSLDGQDFITINVEAGRTYFVEGEILWGWPTGRPKFKQVSESVAVTTPGPTATAGAQTAGSQSQVSGSATDDAMAGPALGSVVAAGSSGANDRGKIGLRNFIGDWELEMWSLAKDGSKLEGSGIAKGTAEGEIGTRIMITEFDAPAFPAATGGGQILISYEPDKGFYLVSTFRYSGEVLRFAGQYQSDTGKYVFYQFVGSGGQTATGMTRSSVRVEVRSLNTASWSADTFSSVDGRSIQVQSYKFTRR